MKIMPCPLNGPRNIQEFICAGPVEAQPDPNRCTDDEWSTFVWMEENRAGVVREWWCHAATSYWFIAERNTVTDEILATYPADRVFDKRVTFDPPAPPAPPAPVEAAPPPEAQPAPPAPEAPREAPPAAAGTDAPIEAAAPPETPPAAPAPAESAADAPAESTAPADEAHADETTADETTADETTADETTAGAEPAGDAPPPGREGTAT